MPWVWYPEARTHKKTEWYNYRRLIWFWLSLLSQHLLLKHFIDLEHVGSFGLWQLVIGRGQSSFIRCLCELLEDRPDVCKLQTSWCGVLEDSHLLKGTLTLAKHGVSKKTAQERGFYFSPVYSWRSRKRSLLLPKTNCLVDKASAGFLIRSWKHHHKTAASFIKTFNQTSYFRLLQGGGEERLQELLASPVPAECLFSSAHLQWTSP